MSVDEGRVFWTKILEMEEVIQWPLEIWIWMISLLSTMESVGEVGHEEI